MVDVGTTSESDGGRAVHQVLLIEDNEMDAEIVRRSFRSDQMSRVNGSIKLTVADSLTQAAELLPQQSYSAILLDLGLPEGTGIEILHRVIAMNLKIPIIILTGNDDDELGYESLRAGADDYLKKEAISPETLPRSVRYSIERNHRLVAEKQLRTTQAEIIAAETIHQRLLPDFSPKLNSFEISGRCIPAEKIGGDLFDYLAYDENSCTGVVADVSGHGLVAAILMTEIHGLLHGLVEQNVSLPRLMAAANIRADHALEAHQFITMISYHISDESNSFSYISAGHPAWIIKANGEHCTLRCQHLPLGITVDNKQMVLSQHKVQTGDIIVLPTDGVFEAVDGQRTRFGTKRMLELIYENSHLSAQEIVECVMSTALKFSKEEKLVDDCTLVVIKVL